MDIANEYPLITVITVVFNNVESIERTIQSVLNQDYKNLEYVVIDGGSKDGTLGVIEQYKAQINQFITAPDEGIYDAMNKGIKMAKGEWINFMNSGDRFTEHDTLSRIFQKKVPEQIKFIYGDFFVDNGASDGKRLFNADYDKGLVLHQSVVYKKELHDYYGLYYVTKEIIVSDYLFFNAVPRQMIQKTDVTISINDGQGVSQGPWCYYQKKCVDYIFGRISIFSLVASFGYYQIRNFPNILSNTKTTGKAGVNKARLS